MWLFTVNCANKLNTTKLYQLYFFTTNIQHVTIKTPLTDNDFLEVLNKHWSIFSVTERLEFKKRYLPSTEPKLPLWVDKDDRKPSAAQSSTGRLSSELALGNEACLDKTYRAYILIWLIKHSSSINKKTLGHKKEDL